MSCLRLRRRGAGGVTFCLGSDYYKFNYNWICGNARRLLMAAVVRLISGSATNGEILQEHHSVQPDC